MVPIIMSVKLTPYVSVGGNRYVTSAIVDVNVVPEILHVIIRSRAYERPERFGVERRCDIRDVTCILERMMRDL